MGEIQKEKEKLRSEPRASKGWWSKTRRLLKQSGKICSIPALKRKKGEWVREAKEKADHLAETFKSKYKLAAKAENEYGELGEAAYRKQEKIEPINTCAP